MPVPAVAEPEAAARRSVVVTVLVGVGVALAVAGVAASLLTIPLFGLARVTEPAHATGRTWFATGLRWAFVVGGLTGLAAGVAAAWWYAKGAPRLWLAAGSEGHTQGWAHGSEEET